MVFSVLFEVAPNSSEWDAYLNFAKFLRPELEKIKGFIDNIRYSSLKRPGTVLSLSNWTDEKALIRWRTNFHHHKVQEKGREVILKDYHLRVGEVIRDYGQQTENNQRLDETETGLGTTVVVINRTFGKEWIGKKEPTPEEVIALLGLDIATKEGLLLGWDVFNAILTPGDVIGVTTWTDRNAAEHFAKSADLPEGTRLRFIRVVRDYGKYDRREAPQYYPDATGGGTVHF